MHDSLGPLAADRLLVAVARRLQSSLRATDVVTRDEPGFTLARLGGDEFMVLIDDITDAGDAVLVAERLRKSLEYPFEVDGHQVFASARVGIAVERAAATAAPTRSCATRRSRSIARRPVVDAPTRSSIRRCAQRAITRLQFETDLRNAIDDRAFEMHYQPIVSLRSGRIVGIRGAVAMAPPGARPRAAGGLHRASPKTPA